MRIARVALGAALLLVPASCGGGPDSAAIGSSATTTTAPVSTGPTTIESPTSTTAPSTSAPSTTAGRTTASTAAVTTTRGPASPRPTSTSTPAVGARCSGAQLTVEVITDRGTYRPGERVQAQATLRNRSAAPCLYNSYTASYRIEDATGQAVGPGPIMIADAFADTPLAAGATLSQHPTWDQKVCPPPAATCTQAPPGTYTVKADWGFGAAPVEGSATFRLLAG